MGFVDLDTSKELAIDTPSRALVGPGIGGRSFLQPELPHQQDPGGVVSLSDTALPQVRGVWSSPRYVVSFSHLATLFRNALD